MEAATTVSDFTSISIPEENKEHSLAVVADQSVNPVATVRLAALSKTVAEMRLANPHVEALPHYMLQPAETEISIKSVQAHTLAQALLYLGVPSSTLPALYNNPHYFFIGLGIGAAGGSLLSAISTTHVGKVSSIWHWLERSAAMANLYKGTIASLHVTGIVANIISTVMTDDNNEFAILEGSVAGTIAAFEGVRFLLQFIHDKTHIPQEVPVNGKEEHHL